VLSAYVGALDTLYPVREGRVVNGVLVGVEEVVGRPQVFRLDQNYPNPFNPSTTIAWELDASSPATVKVYDLLGREVRTLVDGVVAAGPGRVVWGATDDRGKPVPSGVYIYQFRTGDRTQTKKCLLLR
jgi:flagellar hook assembly protein FlgD